MAGQGASSSEQDASTSGQGKMDVGPTFDRPVAEEEIKQMQLQHDAVSDLAASSYASQDWHGNNSRG